MTGCPRSLSAVLALAALLLAAWPADGAAGEQSAPLTPDQKVNLMLAELIGRQVRLTLTDSSIVKGKLVAAGAEGLTIRTGGLRKAKNVDYKFGQILAVQQPDDMKVARGVSLGIITLGAALCALALIISTQGD